uniref:Putative ovule protein n=1 Tax=Solanum chacoense TaxID=4108 RepID=A0A0V0H1A4_SOLCH
MPFKSALSTLVLPIASPKRSCFLDFLQIDLFLKTTSPSTFPLSLQTSATKVAFSFLRLALLFPALETEATFSELVLQLITDDGGTTKDALVNNSLWQSFSPISSTHKAALSPLLIFVSSPK